MAKHDEHLNDSGAALVNPADPVEMARVQETKPARTSTGPGETSVSKSNVPDQKASEDKEPSETDSQPLGTSDDGDQPVDKV